MDRNFDDRDFIVDFEKIADARRNGVSGMMRVKNDAEFIEDSVLSCLDALDELVIVYNGCEDDSPTIIRRLAKSYPEKIRAFEYKPVVHSHNLDEQTFERILKGGDTQVDTLANYNNYALSKTTYKYVLKIDADQVYLTDVLKEWCDVYRTSKASIPTPIDWYNYVKVCLYFRNNKNDFCNFTKGQYSGYIKTVKFLAAKMNIMVSLSGFNVFYDGKTPYLPVGFRDKGVMIMPPFNGVGDTLIFKVTKETRFVPFFNQAYCDMTSSRRTIIEKFKGVRHPKAIGFIWCHLNMNRLNIKQINKKHLTSYPEKFINLDRCVEPDIDDVLEKSDNSLMANRGKKQFRFFYVFQKDRIANLLEKMKETGFLGNNILNDER